MQPESPSAPDYNPATDEPSLDRCVRRLREIAEELGPIGRFLEQSGERVAPGPDFANRFAAAAERLRIPGFCGYKLVVESWTLMELIAVRVIALRKVYGEYGETGNARKMRKPDEIQAAMQEIESALRKTLASMEVYGSLDGNEQVEAMLKRHPGSTG